MVITGLTRNQLYRLRYRGFESHPLRQKSGLLFGKPDFLLYNSALYAVKPKKLIDFFRISMYNNIDTQTKGKKKWILTT